MGSTSPDGELSRQFTLVMLQTYREAARVQIEEAEVAIERALALREHAMAMLARAEELALEYASQVQKDHELEKGPNW